MTTHRPTAIHVLSRRTALQCLGLGALATAWPVSAAVLAVEKEESVDSLPAWLTFPEQQWQRITPAEAGIDTVAYDRTPCRVTDRPERLGWHPAGQYAVGRGTNARRIPGADLGRSRVQDSIFYPEQDCGIRTKGMPR